MKYLAGEVFILNFLESETFVREALVLGEISILIFLSSVLSRDGSRNDTLPPLN